MENGKQGAVEEILLPKQKESNLSREAFVEEVKRVGFLAAPMVAVTLSQFLLQMVTMMMVGHLGELALSSSAVAISISGVTGFSVLVSNDILFRSTFYSVKILYVPFLLLVQGSGKLAIYSLEDKA
ncbi:Protein DETOXIFICATION 14, partial [Cucurbita argyrosperma subsp. argyrosperma]